jgi:hypothetical protein
MAPNVRVGRIAGRGVRNLEMAAYIAPLRLADRASVAASSQAFFGAPRVVDGPIVRVHLRGLLGLRMSAVVRLRLASTSSAPWRQAGEPGPIWISGPPRGEDVTHPSRG